MVLPSPFSFPSSCSVRLTTMSTYRRSNRARKAWKTHFTTGTRGTSRARVTNRSKFTLKAGIDTKASVSKKNETAYLWF